MLNSLPLLRWTFCVAFFSSTIEGSYNYPRQRDAKFSVDVGNSSLTQHSNEQLYSSWSRWTSCSATCGIGFSTRKRSCLKSTYNARGVSVPTCHGELAEHKICNKQNCPPNSKSIREMQCLQHNNRLIGGKLVKEWSPTNGGSNPCELRCESKSEKLVYGFGKVSNGTPCPLGVCLDGRCLQVGCDGRIGSDVKIDMCGICGGRNASCVHYKDVYSGQPALDGDRRSSYSEITVLPTGTRNLIIRQAIGKNFLALRDRKTGIIFNGESSMTKYGAKYDIAGSTVEFLKFDNSSELLQAKSPITEELYVLVLLRSQNRGIYYEYWLPKKPYAHFRNDYSIHPISIASNPTTTTTKQPFVLISRTLPITRPPHHPTKPAFAYGYGEKPYRRKDAPLFRHIPTTTVSSSIEYGDKPSQNTFPPKLNIRSANLQSNPVNKDLLPLYKPKYISKQPIVGYYQTYRNASKNIKTGVLDGELPVLTQQDSSNLNGRGGFDNTIPIRLYDDKIRGIQKSEKPLRQTSVIDKRIDKALKNYVPNGRLKYSVENKDTDEVYLNASGKYAPAPLSIAVKPLPDDASSKSQPNRRNDEDQQLQKPRPTRGGICEPCPRNRNQTKHFCLSDFVIRAGIIGVEFLQGETRYEVDVRQSYKNTLALLPKEYIWSPDTCRCPKLRTGKEYIIMGRIDSAYRKRESRLLVDKTCFARTFNLKYARRLQKLRKGQAKKCKKPS